MVCFLRAGHSVNFEELSTGEDKIELETCLMSVCFYAIKTEKPKNVSCSISHFPYCTCWACRFNGQSLSSLLLIFIFMLYYLGT